MRLTKGFGIGLAAAILAGILLSVAESSVSRTYDPSPMYVPAGRLGDSVTYAKLERGGLSTENGGFRYGQPNDLSEWKHVGDEVHQIGDMLFRVPDRSGSPHETVLVTSNASLPVPTTVRGYYNLTTRELVREITKTSQRGISWSEVESRFGPLSEQGAPIGWQGRTLRLDYDLSGINKVSFVATHELTEADLANLTYRSWVAERALVNGHDAYAVRTEGDLTLQKSALSYQPTRQLLGRAVPAGLPLHFVETVWVTVDSPYPVLIERMVEVRGEARVDVLESMEQLSEFKSGSDPIPWRSEAAGRAPVPGFVERERSGSEYFPADSDEVGYRLSDAVRWVKTESLSPTLVPFRAWLAGRQNQYHEDVKLVGATLTPSTMTNSAGGDAGKSLLWTMRFATPTGASYVVSTERLDPKNSLVQAKDLDHGAESIQAFRFTDFPQNPVSMSTASTWWTQIRDDDYLSVPVNQVVWGMNAARGRPADVKDVDRLVIGFYNNNFAGTSGQGAQSHLEISTDDASLVGAREWRYQWDLVRTARPLPRELLERPPMEAKTVLAGVHPPSIEHGAATTTGAVAVFGLLYFFPLLKFFGAALVMPGYAKLRKDDLLRNKVRDELLQLIRQEPGIHASDLARRIEAGWGTIVYHLSVLEKNKIVSSLVDGRHKRFFPVGEVDWSKRGQIAVLRNEMTKSLFELIAHEPGVIQGVIANRSGLSVPATIWHLKRLEDAGLIGRDKQGRKVHYFTNDPNAAPAPEPYNPDEAVEVV